MTAWPYGCCPQSRYSCNNKPSGGMGRQCPVCLVGWHHDCMQRAGAHLGLNADPDVWAGHSSGHAITCFALGLGILNPWPSFLLQMIHGREAQSCLFNQSAVWGTLLALHQLLCHGRTSALLLSPVAFDAMGAPGRRVHELAEEYSNGGTWLEGCADIGEVLRSSLWYHRVAPLVINDAVCSFCKALVRDPLPPAPPPSDAPPPGA